MYYSDAAPFFGVKKRFRLLILCSLIHFVWKIATNDKVAMVSFPDYNKLFRKKYIPLHKNIKNR